MSAAAANLPTISMLDAALAYAARGWPIFPLKARDKKPLTDHGFKDATTDETQIRRWWKQWPTANIGLWCRDFVVLDVDPRNGGDVSLEALLSTKSDAYDFGTLEAVTGGGGRHYVFKNPDFAVTIPCIGTGLDIKASGGYVVVEPSIHPSGNSYEWIDGDVEPAPMPDWLLEIVREKQAAKDSETSAFVPREGDGDDPFNMKEFIARYVRQMGWKLRGPFPSPEKIGGLAWAVDDGCPFDRTLRGGNPRFGVNDLGAAYFVCHCCNDKHRWADFRKLVVTAAANRKRMGEITGDPAHAGRSIAAMRPSSSPVADDRTWPEPLGNAALIGIAGDAVRLIEPTTESDPAAILFQILVCFGNVIGRSGHWVIEETQHFSNLFAVIVGNTSKGRKGTSLDRVRSLFKGVDEDWEKRNQSGLSSGEGLIWAVRDPIVDTIAIKEKGKKTKYEEEQIDAGEKDKRLLVIESEFSRVLNVAQRDGNTLSDVIRDAWDGRALGTMTKTKRARCSEPHVSIIGHITSDELNRLLTSTDIANGLANRFLFVCAKRSKVLPFGGAAVDWTEMRVRLRSAINNAKRTGEVLMDKPTREKWAQVYEALSSGSGGLYGSVTGRAEAQVRRLACLYALLDESPFIRLEHLDAGLEAWRYCEDSCRFIFSDTLGDPTADSILAMLRRSVDGMTRTEIATFFQKHKKADEIGRALQTLQKIGKARFEREETGGRPSERWFAV